MSLKLQISLIGNKGVILEERTSIWSRDMGFSRFELHARSIFGIPMTSPMKISYLDETSGNFKYNALFFKSRFLKVFVLFFQIFNFPDSFFFFVLSTDNIRVSSDSEWKDAMGLAIELLDGVLPIQIEAEGDIFF